MKYKRMFLLSTGIAIFTTFFVTRIDNGFGFPFNWITYYGSEPITASIHLFYWNTISQSNYDLATLLVNSFIIYFTLLFLYKLLNKINADID